VYADRAFKKMEQVFISYGQKSNAELQVTFSWMRLIDESVLMRIRNHLCVCTSCVLVCLLGMYLKQLLYGFALDRNPFNSVEIAVGASWDESDDPDQSLFNEKLDILRDAGRGDFDGQVELVPCFAPTKTIAQCMRMIYCFASF